jgi:hypothetical protein
MVLRVIRKVYGYAQSRYLVGFSTISATSPSSETAQRTRECNSLLIHPIPKRSFNPNWDKIPIKISSGRASKGDVSALSATVRRPTASLMLLI